MMGSIPIRRSLLQRNNEAPRFYGTIVRAYTDDPREQVSDRRGKARLKKRLDSQHVPLYCRGYTYERRTMKISEIPEGAELVDAWTIYQNPQDWNLVTKSGGLTLGMSNAETWKAIGSIPSSAVLLGMRKPVMKEYEVTWTIPMTATSPKEAARMALEIQQDPNSTATCFSVQGPDGITILDVYLSE